jgi:hypothetical protein
MKIKKEIKRHPLSSLESVIFSPQFIIPIVLFLPFLKEQRYREFVVVFLVLFILPFSFFLYQYKTRKISNWDISKRKERGSLYLAGLCAFVLALWYVQAYATPFIFREYLVFLALGAAAALINLVTKISAHVMSLMVLCILLVTYFQISVLVFLFVPILGISRVILKRHKVHEVLFGVLVPALCYGAVFMIQRV